MMSVGVALGTDAVERVYMVIRFKLLYHTARAKFA